MNHLPALFCKRARAFVPKFLLPLLLFRLHLSAYRNYRYRYFYYSSKATNHAGAFIIWHPFLFRARRKRTSVKYIQMRAPSVIQRAAQFIRYLWHNYSPIFAGCTRCTHICIEHLLLHLRACIDAQVARKWPEPKTRRTMK